MQPADLLELGRLARACASRSRRAPGRAGSSRPACPRPRRCARARRPARARPRASAGRASWRAAGARRRSPDRARRSRPQAAGTPRVPTPGARRLQPLVQRVAQLEQVQHVLARVGELLGRQRPRVPARVARALGDVQSQHAAEQVAVAGLRARGRRSRRRPACRRRWSPRFSRRAAAARRPGARRAARSRSRDRRAPRASGVGSSASSVSNSAIRTPSGRVGVVGDDLHEAQQRAVAALRHELGVDPEAAAPARASAAMCATSSWPASVGAVDAFHRRAS